MMVKIGVIGGGEAKKEYYLGVPAKMRSRFVG